MREGFRTAPSESILVLAPSLNSVPCRALDAWLDVGRVVSASGLTNGPRCGAWVACASATSHSRFPSPPVMGDSIEPTTAQPANSLEAKSTTPSSTRNCRSKSPRTPLPLFSADRPSSPSCEPTSNCGLTRATSRALGEAASRSGQSAGRTSSKEIKLTSTTMVSYEASGSCSAFRWRALTPSMDASRRSSEASFGCSWPWPQSTHTAEAAPALSRQSVKPPVEAPMSRIVAPATSTLNVSSAARSFSPDLETKRPAAALLTLNSASSSHTKADFVTTAPSTATWPAKIADFARVREAQSPRDTSAASSLSPMLTAVVHRRRTAPLIKTQCATTTTREWFHVHISLNLPSRQEAQPPVETHRGGRAQRRLIVSFV